MDETRYGGAFSGNIVLMCMIRGKCAGLRAKVVEVSGQLPVVLKNDHSEFGGISEGFMIMCGGIPLAFTGFVLLVVGLIMASLEKKK